MRLTIYLPSEIYLDEEIAKLVGESPGGDFGILPRHIDMATALVPGILSYVPKQGKESFLAVNGGILVKQKDQVLVSTRMAVRGELGTLQKAVQKFLTEVDEKERKTRSAVAKLEANFVKRIVEFGKNA